MALQSSNALATVVTPSASAMSHVPTEIIEAIGHFLDRPTIYSAIQVCHQWYNIFQPFLWTSITLSQWNHPQFPLNRHPILMWQQQLHRVQHLEWHCSVSVIHRRNTTLNYRSRIIEGTIRKDIWRRPKRFSLTRSKLLSTLQCCTQLTSLSFHKMNAQLLDLKLLSALLQLQRLRRLELNMRGKYDLALMAIEEMFPLFERLDELVLAGSIFSSEEYGNEDEDTSTTTELEIQRPWKMSRLSISPAATMLLRHCPDLKTLERRQFDTWQEYEFDMIQSIRPIMVCTRLTELDLNLSYGQRNQTDIVEILSSFNHLQSLIFNPQSIEQISFLSTRLSYGGDGNDTSNHDLVLPLLEHLELHPDFIQNDSFVISNALRDILKTRRRLKSFVVYKYPIYADHIFAKPGMEDQDGWACLDLEQFWIHIPMLLDALQDEATSTMIYRQLGLLSRLKRVSITCLEISHDAKSGIDLLAGASGLESLALMDTSNVPWTKEEVFRVLQMFPKLSQLYVEPDSKAVVFACAQELGRDISIGPEMGSFN